MPHATAGEVSAACGFSLGTSAVSAQDALSALRQRAFAKRRKRPFAARLR